MFALAGAHRSGKTTTARAIADRMGIDFLETRVGDVFKSLGIDPKAELDFARRLDVQNEILSMLEAQYALRTKPFIADRSPLDVVGYTMADIRRDTLDDDLRDRMTAHVRQAFRVAHENLRGIYVLTPLSNQVETPGKAQSCPYYMDHVFTLIREEVFGATEFSDNLVAVVSDTSNLERRVAYGTAFFKQVKSHYMPEPKIWMPNS